MVGSLGLSLLRIAPFVDYVRWSSVPLHVDYHAPDQRPLAVKRFTLCDVWLDHRPIMSLPLSALRVGQYDSSLTAVARFRLRVCFWNSGRCRELVSAVRSLAFIEQRFVVLRPRQASQTSMAAGCGVIRQRSCPAIVATSGGGSSVTKANDNGPAGRGPSSPTTGTRTASADRRLVRTALN